ncbi:MAG: helix-turn-helix domain-containing protein [Geminicoccaceae bacterium]|nr:helix-turn-helix domain-containing protein [Geminicoccaceae bacterium]MDW8125870.1 helix-turn-helix transcriptional regulator [Geminicoccaceae bacterium]
MAQRIGRRLALGRTLAGKTREQLARQLGLSAEQIRRYERGVTRLDVARLLRLARLIGLPPGWFFEDESSSDTPPRLLGLAEPSFGFVFDPPRRPVAPPAPPPVDRRETLELVRAFTAIADAELRRCLVELVRAISEASTSSGTRGAA